MSDQQTTLEEFRGLRPLKPRELVGLWNGAQHFDWASLHTQLDDAEAFVPVSVLRRP